MPPLWRCEHIRVGNPKRPRLSCDGLEIRPGITAVMGPSGAGKSTLLNLLVGFIRPDAGQLQAALPLDPARLPLFWSPQDEGLWPHLNVRQQLTSTCAPSDAPRCDAILKELELDTLGTRRIDAISIGEQSRLAVARAMAANPSVALLDEPFSHVDRVRRHAHWAATLAWARTTGASVIFATHSPRMVLGHADHVILLRNGAVAFDGTVDDLYWNPATAESAAALGPVNWIGAGEATIWLPGAGDNRNYRPCQLSLEEAPAGSPLHIEHSHFAGDTMTVRLCHTPSGACREFSVPAQPLPPAGTPVRLLLRTDLQQGGAT
jgi:iron(III) transport system ATP-binding protein